MSGNDGARRKVGKGKKIEYNEYSQSATKVKERKNDNDRTKTACEEGKLNTTEGLRSHLRSP